MRRLRIIIACLLGVALIIAGLIWASPWIAERGLVSDCLHPQPSALCVERMRVMGHVWSRFGRIERAGSWYERAADEGDAAAMFHLAWIHQERARREREDNFRRMAERSDSEASSASPAVARAPDPGEAESELAEDWYRKSAEKGYAPAMNNLGQLLLNGPHQNVDAAFEWHMDAARAGNPVGCWNVSIAYMAGHGVARDRDEAIRWSTWTPNQGSHDDLGEPTLQRTILFGSTLAPERRSLLRAAAAVGEPVTFTLVPLQPNAALPTFKRQ
jgi:TPR repeat protein